MFNPIVRQLEEGRLARFLRGNAYAYVDIIDSLGIMHQYVFEGLGLDAKIDNTYTDENLRLGSYRVAIIFIHSRSKLEEIEKATKIIASEIAEIGDSTFELYKNVNEYYLSNDNTLNSIARH